MNYPTYAEKDSSQIYEELSSQEDNYLEDDEERSSDHMSEMISRYGNY
jgi:hypothetical protein